MKREGLAYRSMPFVYSVATQLLPRKDAESVHGFAPGETRER